MGLSWLEVATLGLVEDPDPATADPVLYWLHHPFTEPAPPVYSVEDLTVRDPATLDPATRARLEAAAQRSREDLSTWTDEEFGGLFPWLPKEARWAAQGALVGAGLVLGAHLFSRLT